MKFVTFFKMACGATASILSYLFGGIDMLFQALLFCVACDYITGIMAAIYEKNLNSSKSFKGLLKKIAILLLVALGHCIGQVTGAEAVREMVIGFYIANEGISILENCGRMELPVANKLKNILEKLNDR